MAVVQSDVKIFRAVTNNDEPASNGGKRSYNEVVSAVMNNLFPNVSHAERVAGIKRWRKCFLHNMNLSDISFENVKFFIDFPATGEDYYRACLAGHDDVQSAYVSDDVDDVLGGYRFECGSKSGAGTIEVGSEVTVNGEAAKQGIVTEFVDGDYIIIRVISDDASDIFENGDAVCLVGDPTTYVTLSSAAGARSADRIATGHLTLAVAADQKEIEAQFYNEYGIRGHLMPGDFIFISSLENSLDVTHYIEFHEVASVEWDAGLATCKITTVNNIAYSYSITNTGVGGTYYTRVGKLLDAGALVADFDNLVETLGGTFDENLMTIHNKGAVSDSVTITFTSSSAFTVTGITIPSYGTGTIGGNFAPTNPDTLTPYFTIPSSCWAGSFVVGNTVEFDVLPSVAPIWFEEIVEAGAASISNDSTWLMAVGESA